MKTDSFAQNKPITTNQLNNSPATSNDKNNDTHIQIHTHSHTQKVADKTPVQLMRLTQIAERFGILVDSGTANSAHKKFTLGQRAKHRKYKNTIRKQENVEMITTFARDYVDNQHTQDEVDPDWLYLFFEMAESIFSPSMQQLWGKILAMQIARPGTFSLRTLQTLKQMTYREAIMFQHACALMVKDKVEYGGKIITGHSKQASLFDFLSNQKHSVINLSKFKLSYPEILSLIDLNLLYASEIETSPLTAHQKVVLEGTSLQLTIEPVKSNLMITFYKFTQIGNELARLILVDSKSDYFSQISDAFTKSGCSVSIHKI